MSRLDMDTNSNIIRLLTEVSATLTSNGDINHIINTVLLQLREYANVALIELWVLNPEKELLIRQEVSFEKSNRKIADFLAARNTAGYSFDTLTESVCRVSNDYILIPEIKADRSFRSDIATASDLNTNLVYPLLHKDNLLGVLIVHNDLHFESVDNLLTVIKPIAHHLTTTIVLNKVNLKLEDVLKLPEELVLNNVVSSLDDVVFEYDKEGNFKNLWCNNDSVLQLIPKEYVGKSMTDAYHALPELTGAFIQDFENAISNNEVCYRDFSLSIKEEIRWFNSKITPLLSPDSISRGFSQRITDITDQKKVDLAISEKNLELRSAHRELKEIIENTSEIIFKLNQDDSIIFVSAEFERSLGFPGSEMVGTHIQNLIHPDDRERFKNELIDARKNGKSTSHSIFRAVNRSGIDRWFNISAKFVRTSQSESFIGIVFAQDVTELKLAMDSLSVSEERYRSIVNALGEGIVIHDNKGNIIACNQSAEKIFDLPKGGALGDTISRSTLNAIKENGSPFPVFEFPAFITLRTGVPVKEVVMGVYKRNGDLVWIKLNTEPVYY
ncbi:MAG TPA: PAS domain S-box protein, partial [Flavitalea sp.]|nr:PAS domain S-box protein [Flavitalea sp.]